MQRLAREILQRFDHGLAGSRRNAETTAVGRVAHQREVDVGHVHTDLVGPAGFQLDPHMGVGTETLEHAIMADRLLAALHYRHALALLAVTTDGGVDLATGGDDPDHDAFIDPADAAALQLCDQLCLRLDGLGHHHQAGGVLVQAMDDAGTRHIDNVRYVVQQGVEQRAVGMASSRVHHQARRLVDHQDVIVFIDDVQGDVLGDPFSLGLLFGSQFKNGTAVDDVARTDHRPIHSQAAVLDPGGKARARVLGKELCGDLIEALAAQFGRHLCAKFYFIGHARTGRRHSLWFRLRACG